MPTDVIERMLDTASTLPDKIYEAGDFIVFYEGMGEVGHGTVISDAPDERYLVNVFGYGEWNAYDRTVSVSDMGNLTTPKKAKDYYDIRSGNCRVKLYLRKAA